MRKLAATLNVEAMSLYNHVKDKQDLLDGLCDLVLSQIERPAASLSWSQRLETIAMHLYAALIRHPALVLILASEKGRPTDLRVLEGIDSLVAALAESGLSTHQQVSAYRGLLAMCFGFVLTHTQGLSKTREQAQQAWDQWDSHQWNPDVFPHLAQLAPQFQQTHAEDDFKLMLRAYLNALQAASTGQQDLI
jgi:TetR/AcrR family transcriptional regulator, tetracycline repressor protein